MTQKFLIVIAMVMGLQATAFATSNLPRVDFVNKNSVQARLQNKALLLSQIATAEETLRELKANLADAVDSNFTYKAAVSVRNGNLIAGGVTALAWVGLFVQSRMNLSPEMRMINFGGQWVAGLSSLVSFSNSLVAEGVVKLSGQEIEALEARIQDAEIGLQVLKTQLAQ
jgi:hypothetical protein